MRSGLNLGFALLLAGLTTAASSQEPIVRIKPLYPDAAVAQRITGYVKVELAIGEGGVVQDLAVVESSAKIFDDAVIAALRKWRYAKDAAGSSLSETIEFTIADLEVELAKRNQRSSNSQDR
jgi:TonB family protein